MRQRPQPVLYRDLRAEAVGHLRRAGDHARRAMRYVRDGYCASAVTEMLRAEHEWGGFWALKKWTGWLRDEGADEVGAAVDRMVTAVRTCVEERE